MTYWLDDTATLPKWLEMEQEACQPYSIGAILLSPYTIEKSVYNCNLVIHSTLRIWKQIRSHYDPYFMLYLSLETLLLPHLI